MEVGAATCWRAGRRGLSKIPFIADTSVSSVCISSMFASEIDLNDFRCWHSRIRTCFRCCEFSCLLMSTTQWQRISRRKNINSLAKTALKKWHTALPVLSRPSGSTIWRNSLRANREQPLHPQGSIMTTASVRYIVEDVAAAVEFYITHLGSTVVQCCLYLPIVKTRPLFGSLSGGT